MALSESERTSLELVKSSLHDASDIIEQLLKPAAEVSAEASNGADSEVVRAPESVVAEAAAEAEAAAAEAPAAAPQA